MGKRVRCILRFFLCWCGVDEEKIVGLVGAGLVVGIVHCVVSNSLGD